MPAPGAKGSTDDVRIRYGFWVVLAGILAVLIVFVAAAVRWTEASDVATVVGSVTAVIGTLVGAFFGFQVGSEGRAAAERARAEAEGRAMRLAAHLEPRVASKALSES
ncbi:MAG TPA: hypothetical protein VLL77_06255 [Anaerolineales bacterium]|nr:hypothetical protein [Anaerolineales bacterium]